VARSGTLPFRWLGAPLPVYLGRVSYSIYLSHHVLLEALQRNWPQLGWSWMVLLAATLTLLFAEGVRRWVERPCLKLRRRLRRHSPPAVPLTAAAITPPQA